MNKLTMLVTAVATIVFALIFGSAHKAVQAGHRTETTRVSVSSVGAEGNDISVNAAISATGRFVAFGTRSDNLVPGDTNGAFDILLHDRKTGETTRVSVDSLGNEANGSSFSPALSASGRFVGFCSGADNLVPEDTNGVADIFVHDRKTGETTRVSVNSFGFEANGPSPIDVAPAISASGRFVAFNSEADNLVPDDTNGVSDIFVHDRKTGETTRVSVDSFGTEGNFASFDFRGPAISATGRFVTFASGANNLVPNDTNNNFDIFVHDRKTGETTRVNVDSNGTQGEPFSSVGPSISATGRFVAFASRNSNLVPGDTNGAGDVFVHDRKTGETTRVSVDSFGVEGNGTTGVAFRGPDISATGRFVAFSSRADNLVPGDTNGLADPFVHDRKTGKTTRVNVDSNGVEGNGLGAGPAISATGRFVAFASFANNLVPRDTNGTTDVFVHKRKPSRKKPRRPRFWRQ